MFYIAHCMTHHNKASASDWSVSPQVSESQHHSFRVHDKLFYRIVSYACRPYMIATISGYTCGS